MTDNSDSMPVQPMIEGIEISCGTCKVFHVYDGPVALLEIKDIVIDGRAAKKLIFDGPVTFEGCPIVTTYTIQYTDELTFDPPTTPDNYFE